MLTQAGESSRDLTRTNIINADLNVHCIETEFQNLDYDYVKRERSTLRCDLNILQQILKVNGCQNVE